MMVIYGKVFQAARARIHKKRFRSGHQPQTKHQQQQQHQDLLTRHRKALTQQLETPQQKIQHRFKQRNYQPREEQKEQLERPKEPLQEHCGQQQQQQQLSDVDGGQVASSASDGIIHTGTPDDPVDALNSLDSESPSLSERPVTMIEGGTKVTLTVVNCDDDEEEDVENIDGRNAVDRGPLQPVIRPTRLALCEPERPRNGTQSPSESLETPSRSLQLLTTPQKSSPDPYTQKSSPTPSLRSSWLDLTKQFIMDRKKCFSVKTKVSN